MIAYTVQTNRLANLWTTEFHITFYKCHSGQFDEPEKDRFVRCPVEMTLKSKLASLTLVKVTQGFRMVGDMYDRVWTSWILSRVPGAKALPSTRLETFLPEDTTDDSDVPSDLSDLSDQFPWRSW